MMMIIILSIIGSLITGPDWSGRYRMYIMPFIFIFASEFIENFLKKKFVNMNYLFIFFDKNSIKEIIIELIKLIIEK